MHNQPMVCNALRSTRSLSIRLLGLVTLTFSLFYHPATKAGEISAATIGMPGHLYDLGTHQLHMFCVGDGTPTVIIDSGLGGFSLEWQDIQQILSRDVQVCTYDRAGYGWSEIGPGPRTTEQITKELHQLLDVADVKGPYILVGHSFGGYNIRYYASTYPQEVVGLVLVDASHPDQFQRLPKRKVHKRINKHRGFTVRISMPVIPANYPENRKHQAFRLMASFKALRTKDQEWENFRLSAQQVNDHDYLPDIPLAVVTRGKRVWPHNQFGDASELAWKEMQDELCLLTSHSEHYIAKKSGHLVHLDEPELVLKAINRTLNKTSEIQAIRLALQEEKPTFTLNERLFAGNNYYAESAGNQLPFLATEIPDHYYQSGYVSAF